MEFEDKAVGDAAQDEMLFTQPQSEGARKPELISIENLLGDMDISVEPEVDEEQYAEDAAIVEAVLEQPIASPVLSDQQKSTKVGHMHCVTCSLRK